MADEVLHVLLWSPRRKKLERKELPNEPATVPLRDVDEMVEGNTRRIVADPVSAEGSVEIELTG